MGKEAGYKKRDSQHQINADMVITLDYFLSSMKRSQEFYKISDMRSSIPLIVSSLYCVEKHTAEHRGGIRDTIRC